MSTIWRTRPGDRSPFGACVCAAALCLSVGLFGCGATTPPGPEPSPHTVGANDPAWITNRQPLPPPDTDRLNYDERTRTLTLYNLPGNDRWMVQFPGETGQQATPRLRIPDLDLSEVMVYYTRPGLKASAPVSVKQIMDSGYVSVSLAAP